MLIILKNLFYLNHDLHHVELVNCFNLLTIYSGLLRLKSMRYLTHQITFQEIPDEISLSFLITGCPLRCKNCHSSDSWNPRNGQILNENTLENFIQKYRPVITCVLFMGGEWLQDELYQLLSICQKHNLKTALYTGLNEIHFVLKNKLTFLKTGSWQQERGNLTALETNQKLINLTTGEILNYKFTAHFTAQGGQYGQNDGRSNQQKDKLY